MNDLSVNGPPVPAVGIVCFRGDEVLLIRRGTPPLAGSWSIPGGRIEPGEPARDAALRELMEETGVAADLVGLIDVIDAIMPPHHYVLIDYAARWASGEPLAGDDAIEARFMPIDGLSRLELWDETRRIISAGWAMLTDQ